MEVHFSSARTGSAAQDEWKTPRVIVDLAVRVLEGITLDPCADPERSIPAARHYTVEDDGLSAPWTGERVYMNPPYSQARHWVETFLTEEIESGIALLPARPGSRWWTHLTDERCPICLIRGRLTFEGAPNCAPFPSVLVYRGRHIGRFIEETRAVGDVWIRV